MAAFAVGDEHPALTGAQVLEPQAQDLAAAQAARLPRRTSADPTPPPAPCSAGSGPPRTPNSGPTPDHPAAPARAQSENQHQTQQAPLRHKPARVTDYQRPKGSPAYLHVPD